MLPTRVTAAAILLTGLTVVPADTPGRDRVTSAPASLRFAPDEILLRFKPAARAHDKAAARAGLNASHLRSFRSGAEHWRLGPGVGVEQAVQRMRANPNVAYAEPNYLIATDVVPDDPRAGEMWGLINTGQTGGTPDADIDAEMAWEVSTGSRDVIVAVLDSGCDYNHPDLAANIWTNPGEIPGNRVDDDRNGFVDDVHGYDFRNNDGDPFDDNGHGTHVAGTIGAVGNNGVGVAGVNWQVRILCAKFLSSFGNGFTSDAIRALDYAVQMGADLTNNSYGGGDFSQAFIDAVAEAIVAEQPFVAGAGNNNRDTDLAPHYPSSFDLPNVIAVAATDHNDTRASFSNYGAASVDLGAPGVNIWSTLPGNSYGSLSGTSMATPHVSGVAALLRAVSPGIPAAQLKSRILSQADPVPSLQGITVTGGRLNAFLAIATPDGDPPGPIGDLATGNPGSTTMGLTWSATGDDGPAGTAAYYQVRYSTLPIDEAGFAMATRAGGEPEPAPAGQAEGMEVGGLAPDTTYHFAVKAFDEWGNPGPISNMATGRTLSPPTGSVVPGSLRESLLTGQQAARTVTLSNVGAGTLDFTIPTPILGEPLATQETALDLGKDEPDPREGEPVTEGRGGPDAFGYQWVDSDEPGGPAFAWEEISTIGTIIPISLDDQTSKPITFGFTFPFYGRGFRAISVCTNGWLSFTSSLPIHSNQPLPSAGAPNNLIAPFWDDLSPDAATRIYYHEFQDRIVFEWMDVPRFGEPGSRLTFQAILHATGTITFQYLRLDGVVNSATVGIQDETRTRGLLVAFNQDYLHENLAVRLSALPRWLSVAPTAGRLRAGESTLLNVSMDASGLDGGTYPSQIRIETNEPANPLLIVDVNLDVTAGPDIAVEPPSLDYGDAFLGGSETLMLKVTNRGSATLHVGDIVPSHAELSVSPASLELPPRWTQSVSVTWAPSSLGPFSGSLSLLSDDPGDSSIVVPLAGNGIPAPVLQFAPSSLSETLLSDEMVTRTVNVQNTGGSPLAVAAADRGPRGSGATEEDPGEGAEGSGGPDAFGYRWRDSRAPGGPSFQWVDIGATGTPVSFPFPDNSLSPVIDLGMLFPMYESRGSAIRISTNGWLTFAAAVAVQSLPNNEALPSPSLPGGSIALFWDDLHLRSGNVRYLNDGTRFIVQYTNVGRSAPSTGQSYTLQAQLYPNGQIIILYLSMSGVLDSATVGIQRMEGGTALQVAFNSPYVDNDLAVRFSRLADWLSVSPTSATVQSGQGVEFAVKFDASGRTAGTLNGNVVLSTNAPGQSRVLIPATLNVIGAPEVGLTPSSLSFGTRFVGYSHLSSFQIQNLGTGDLTVSGLGATDPSLIVEDPPAGIAAPQGSFVVAPYTSRLMNVRWVPLSAGPLSAQVRVHTDDPLTPVTTISVTGDSIVPPAAILVPSSVAESVLTGDALTRTLDFENQGGSDLTFGTSIRAAGTSGVTVYPEVALDKDQEDPRPGILGSGGPDLFGYTWRDSDDPNGPVFSWFDITSIGEPIFSLDGDDESSDPLEIGFPFPFYGNTFTMVRATTNGWLSFTSFISDPFNDPLPSSASAENLIAVFFDDLDFRGARRATYYGDGSVFVVQWTNVDRRTAGSRLTFQVILYPNGRIVMQYLTMSGVLDSATIGIQNASVNDGLTVAFNSAYVHNNMAVEFRRPFEFLSVHPSSGTIPPDGSLDLDLRLDATTVSPGDYEAVLDLTTNDPARGLISVPVTLHVVGIPDIEVEPGALAFPETFAGFGRSLDLTIGNIGTDVLHVTDAQMAGEYRLEGVSFPLDLPAGGTVPARVRFTPAGEGAHPGSLTISSDDPDEGTLVVPLSGRGLFPPVVGASPSSFGTALPPGGSRTKGMTVLNTGRSDLNWSAGLTFPSGSVSPASGTVPAGGGQDVAVVLDATGLADGLHAGSVEVSSNDPHTPVLTVRVTLNVGVVAPTYFDCDPDVLNLLSSGNTITCVVELPAGLDPRGIRLSSVLLNDAVPPLPRPVSYGDADGDGIEEIEVKFDRSAVEAILPVGDSVPVCVQGEVEDVQWWRGCTAIRTIRPRVTSPAGGEYVLTGSVVPVRWTAPAWSSPLTYTVEISRDGGATWDEIGSGLTGTSLDWTAAPPETARARVRVLVLDNRGLLGLDVTDGEFTIAGPVLLPPRPVEGATIEVEVDGGELVLAWRAPAGDLAHGPAERYRILRADAPAGPYEEVAVTTGASYSEPLSATGGGGMVLYKVVAANAAGDAE
jgi:subtilisin family serine protease